MVMKLYKICCLLILTYGILEGGYVYGSEATLSRRKRISDDDERSSDELTSVQVASESRALHRQPLRDVLALRKRDIDVHAQPDDIFSTDEDLTANAQATLAQIYEKRATLRVTKAAKNDSSAKSDDESREEGAREPEVSLKKVSINNAPTSSISNAPISSMYAETEKSSAGSGVKEALNWPRGRYALPKSVQGCPAESEGFSWKSGYVYQDTEDDGTENQRSDVFQMAANFSDDGISYEFCVKDAQMPGEGEWPEGKYCIYKRGPVCPGRMNEGFVFWDDENTDNQNDRGGYLPEGEYNEDTKILFCCSTSGSQSQQIYLPHTKPFYLFAYQSMDCQKVHSMKVTSQFIKFDDEDNDNKDRAGGTVPFGIRKGQHDNLLFLCYYEYYDQGNSDDPSARDSEEYTSTAVSALDDADVVGSLALMNEFLNSTSFAVDEPEAKSKTERTSEIIKTIVVKNNERSLPKIIGLISAGIMIGMVTFMFARRFVVSRSKASQKKPSREGKIFPEKKETRALSKNECVVETTGNDKMEIHDKPTLDQYLPTQPYNFKERVTVAMDNEEDDEDDARSNEYFLRGGNDSDFVFDDDDNELVEDQLLPDSALKSGLELLFLKQQRHYWSQKIQHKRKSYFH